MTQLVVNPASRRRTWIVTVFAVLLGLVLSGGLVWKASYSAFSSTTANPTNNWSTGTVNLTDNDGNTALFTVSNMKPGASGSRCIQVTSNGTLPASVKLYTTASSYTQTNGVGDNVTLTVSLGSQTNFAADCTGFTSGSTAVSAVTLTSFSTTYTNFGNGAGSWSPTGSPPENKVYRFDYTFSASAPNSTQNGSAAIGFTWEAQNT